jgi:predicted DNA-binding transcriptional regulator AlpA
MTNLLARADTPMHAIETPVYATESASAGERLLDVRQLSRYLGLDNSRLWLMRLLQASLRGPRAVRIAGHSYWWRSDVDQWLAENDLAQVLRCLGEDLIGAAARVPG